MLLATAALVAWICVWILVAVRVLRRRDLGAGGKVLWIVVILVVPLLASSCTSSGMRRARGPRSTYIVDPLGAGCYGRGVSGSSRRGIASLTV